MADDGRASAASDALAGDLLKRWNTLKGERGTWESHWEEIAELMRPFRADFTAKRSDGEKRQQKIYDGAALLAVENLASGLWGMVSNAANTWFQLDHRDRALASEGEIREWLDAATQVLVDIFNANGGRFYVRAHELYADLSCFGTGVFKVEADDAAGDIHFRCEHLAECCIAEDAHGRIDTLYRMFEMTARALAQRYPGKVSPAVQKATETSPFQRFAVLEATLPRDEIKRDGMGAPAIAAEGQPVRAVVVEVQSRRILDDRGLEEFPFMVPRWSTVSRGVYGDSPAMLALPDVKMVNVISKTGMVGAAKAIDPPLLAPDERIGRGVKTHPGHIIYGGLDPMGNARLVPLQLGQRLELGFELEEQRRTAIREAFHFSLMMLAQKPSATATEVLALQEEKLRLMGPQLGRLHAEFLDPLIARVFAIASRSGRLPPPPPRLANRPALKVAYASPLARAQKTMEGQAILRTLQPVMGLAQAKPEILDNFDLDQIARGLAEAFALPGRLMRDPRKVAQLRQQRAEAQEKMQAAAQAPVEAKTAKDLAGAVAAAMPQREAA